MPKAARWFALATLVTGCEGSVDRPPVGDVGAGGVTDTAGGSTSGATSSGICADAESALASTGAVAPDETVHFGVCLEHPRARGADGRVACVVFEMFGADPCVCDASSGRSNVEHLAALAVAQDEATAAGLSASCVCELHQATRDELLQCAWPDSTEPSTCELRGFGYADAETGGASTCSPSACDTGVTLCFGPVGPHAGATLVAVCGSDACTG